MFFTSINIKWFWDGAGDSNENLLQKNAVRCLPFSIGLGANERERHDERVDDELFGKKKNLRHFVGGLHQLLDGDGTPVMPLLSPFPPGKPIKRRKHIQKQCGRIPYESNFCKNLV